MQLISQGFQDALTPTNIAFVILGTGLGTIIGLLPGLGSATGVAILLPVTLGLDPLTALIMLAGIYYGTQYGGSITAVLLATPGDASQVVTVFDGYQMARQGRAGPALAICAIGSFVAGTLTIPLLMVLIPFLGALALRFGPPEQFALMLFAMVSASGIGVSDRAKGLAMAGLGLGLSTVGLDPVSGVPRFTFGETSLLAGVGFIPAVIGLFAVGEVLAQIGIGGSPPVRTAFRDMLPSRTDLTDSFWPTIRASFLGFFIGVLPGAGAAVASFVSYDLESKISKHGKEFGTGRIEAVAAPEAANNAAVNGSFAPTLVLGIPGSATTAVLLGALILHGIRPGPLFLEEQSRLAWGLMASFYLGNVTLLMLNLPLAPVFALLLRIRYTYLYPGIIMVSLLGAFAIDNRMFSVWTAAVFGGVGYLMARNGYPPAPLVLGLILGGLMEPAFAQTTRIAFGDWTYIFSRPIAGGFLLLAILTLAVPVGLSKFRGRKPSE